MTGQKSRNTTQSQLRKEDTAFLSYAETSVADMENTAASQVKRRKQKYSNSHIRYAKGITINVRFELVLRPWSAREFYNEWSKGTDVNPPIATLERMYNTKWRKCPVKGLVDFASQ